MAPLEKKNIHPVLAVFCNWLVLGILGYILIGQTNKSIYILISTLIGTVLCCVPGIVISVLALVDVYYVAAAVERGETVDENEYKVEFLYKMCKIIHKDAIFNG